MCVFLHTDLGGQAGQHTVIHPLINGSPSAASPVPLFLYPNIEGTTSFVTCQRTPFKLFLAERGSPLRKYFTNPEDETERNRNTCLYDVLRQHPVSRAQPIRTAAKWLGELSVSPSTGSCIQHKHTQPNMHKWLTHIQVKKSVSSITHTAVHTCALVSHTR